MCQQPPTQNTKQQPIPDTSATNFKQHAYNTQRTTNMSPRTIYQIQLLLCNPINQ